jgi:hypothetical protein
MTQIVQLAMSAGFPSDVAAQMGAIAMRESGGCATAHNPGPGEDSYGLWQINVQGNPGIMTQLGLSDPTQLYDPATNAAAAALLWGGNPNNLNVAWYINQPGYSQAYQANLPAAQAAVATLIGSDSTLPSLPDLTAANLSTIDPASSGTIDWTTLAWVAVGALGLLALSGDL